MIPYGRQDISESDIQAVVDVLKSDLITQGPVVPIFEKTVSEYCGAQFAVAVNSATSALHIACLVLGVNNGDIVWTSPITFVASANCALYCGAQIDFIDIDPQTCNISIKSLEKKLENARRNDLLPKVLIPVHFGGQSCDMESIDTLAKRYGFKVIEDASHAIGGTYQEKPIGCGDYSDITVFSFHPVKIITSGEGGMAVTNSSDLAGKLQLLRSHGITRDKNLTNRKPDGPWYYQQVELGLNYRMTDIHAALGLSQFQRIDKFISRRHEIEKCYNKLLADLPVTLPYNNTESYSALHLYVIRLQLDKISKSHLKVFEQLRSHGIGVNLHYIPVYHQPYYKKMGFKIGYCPEAEKYYSEAITLPLYPALTNDEQNIVVSSLREILTG